MLVLAAAIASAAAKPDSKPTLTFSQFKPGVPLRLVAYGDTRFTDPSVTSGTNPHVRRWLVERIAVEHPAVLLMTGRCTDGLNLFDISGKSDWAQRQAVRYRWCEVWHDPKQNGDFTTGWVYGKYIRPY